MILAHGDISSPLPTGAIAGADGHDGPSARLQKASIVRTDTNSNFAVADKAADKLRASMGERGPVSPVLVTGGFPAFGYLRSIVDGWIGKPPINL